MFEDCEFEDGLYKLSCAWGTSDTAELALGPVHLSQLEFELTHRRFHTKREMKAYECGIEDAIGYLDGGQPVEVDDDGMVREKPFDHQSAG